MQPWFSLPAKWAPSCLRLIPIVSSYLWSPLVDLIFSNCTCYEPYLKTLVYYNNYQMIFPL